VLTSVGPSWPELARVGPSWPSAGRSVLRPWRLPRTQTGAHRPAFDRAAASMGLAPVVQGVPRGLLTECCRDATNCLLVPLLGHKGRTHWLRIAFTGVVQSLVRRAIFTQFLPLRGTCGARAKGDPAREGLAGGWGFGRRGVVFACEHRQGQRSPRNQTHGRAGVRQLQASQPPRD
jgi:hypothetical protein